MLQIIECLRKDARQPIRSISASVKVPKSTIFEALQNVHIRYVSLIRCCSIRYFVLSADPGLTRSPYCNRVSILYGKVYLYDMMYPNSQIAQQSLASIRTKRCFPVIAALTEENASVIS